MRSRGVWAALAFLVLCPAWGQAAGGVGWMIYPYHLPTKDEEYQRLLNCKEAEYVGVQWFASAHYSPDDPQARRAAELRQAGRKIIVDLWFGGSGDFSWRYFNLPGIALDPRVRQDFFDKCTDPFLEHFGAENLYAVHLMEETGMQFGWDVDVAGYPDDKVGYDNGSNWDNPASFAWGRSVAGTNNLNVRKYNDIFRKETGLDMRLSPLWTAAETATFNRWVQRNMEGGAHVQFARHVHEKYPGLKVYAFNGADAAVAQSEVLDGEFRDPYASTGEVFHSLRGYRSIMRPDEEFVAMVWGNREKPIPQRMPQMAACFIGGADILSTFGDNELMSDEWLNVVRDSVRPFLGRPRFVARPQVLYLGGRPLFGASLQASNYWTTGFADYDAQPFPKPLDPYKFVFSWGEDRPDLEPWVKAGGILVGVYAGDELLTQAGLIADTAKSSNVKTEYRPDEWMRQNFALKESYQLDLGPVRDYEVKDPNLVHKDQFVYVAQYGQGLVVLLPAIQYVHPPWQYEPEWEVYRQFLTDLCRGALWYRRLPAVAQTYFDDPELGNDYLKSTSKDGLTVYILRNDIHGPEGSKTSFKVPGLDLVTGERDVTFGPEHPVVMIQKGGN